MVNSLGPGHFSATASHDQEHRVSLKAFIVTVLSLGCTLGIIVAIFPYGTEAVQKAWDFLLPLHIDGSNIFFIFSILFGISVDYQKNLVREEAHFSLLLFFLPAPLIPEFYPRSHKSVRN